LKEWTEDFFGGMMLKNWDFTMIWIHLLTWFKGVLVGQDSFGNKYYRMKGKPRLKERRWVLYKGMPEPSKIPPAWFCWLHHITADPPPREKIKKWEWEKNHLPNLTGTSYAYVPSRNSGRKPAIIEKGYEAWRPHKGKHENKST